MNILVTGCAGFIGFHCSEKLLKKKIKIYGIDNLNNYYDDRIKKKRLKILRSFKNFKFYKLDICDEKKLNNFFLVNKINIVIHLAAQAGVRYSFINPKKYLDVNINGFFNILECMKKNGIQKLLYASSSSVYGDNKKFPLSEKMPSSKQISLYGTTKKYNEILAYYYFKQFKISSYGLRFFTAYGIWGRPDMSIFNFCKNIMLGKKINVFNYGNHERDFTFVDDVIESIYKMTKKIKTNQYKIINIAGGNSVKLMSLIRLIEKNLNKKAKINYLNLQKGDVVKTLAATKFLKKTINKKKNVKIKDGLKIFCDWFRKEQKFLLKLKN